MNIKLENVSKIIQRNTVLEDVSLELESGTVYGLWGKNGSGKTMLMRVISGLIRPTSGRVLINGKELGDEFPESVGLLIENPSFLDGYTGLQNLRMLASIRGKLTDQDVRETLERVGLEPGDRRPFRKYSLGMKQRLGIACAIMEKPNLILLDEPINALDVDGAELVHGILEEEKKRGALIVISCHDADEMNALAEVVYTIRAGRIVEERHLRRTGEECL